jgi:death-on-curing protein
VTPPLFLDIERVLRIHKSLIEHYGGSEGVRDVGLLHSALAMPQASFGGQLLHRYLFEMAAAYLYNSCKTTPSSTATSASEPPRQSSF